MTTEVEKALDRITRRLMLRRGLALASALLPVGCGAALLMLLSLRGTAPESSSTVLAVTLAGTLALICSLTWWTRPTRRDAARAMDRAEGDADVVLAATSPVLGGASLLTPMLQRAAQRAASCSEPTMIVPLPSRRGLALGSALVLANALLAAMPPEQTVSTEVAGVQRLFQHPVDDEAVAPALDRLRRETEDVRDVEKLRAVLDRHWNDRRREHVDELLRALTEAVERGDRSEDARETATAAARADLTKASPEVLGALAEAVARAIERGELPESLVAADDTAGAVAGIAAALGAAASDLEPMPPAPRPTAPRRPARA